MTGSQATRGFTLLEVLAAIALLAIALAVGLGALGKAAHNAARSAALDAAVEHAQTLFAEQGLALPLKNAEQSGTFADGMHWTLTSHALPTPEAEGLAAVPLGHGGMRGVQASRVDIYQLDVGVEYAPGHVLRLSTQRAQAGQPAP